MKRFRFEIDGEVYEMTMRELAQNISREFAKSLLSEEEYNEFCETQENIWTEQRLANEEYCRTHYIYDELRDAY